MTSRQPVVEMIDPMMVEILRDKTPAERLAIACGMAMVPPLSERFLYFFTAE